MPVPSPHESLGQATRSTREPNRYQRRHRTCRRVDEQAQLRRRKTQELGVSSPILCLLSAAICASTGEVWNRLFLFGCLHHTRSPGCSTAVTDWIATCRAKWVRGGLYATAEPNGLVGWATVPFRSNVIEPNRPARFTSMNRSWCSHSILDYLVEKK